MMKEKNPQKLRYLNDRLKDIHQHQSVRVHQRTYYEMMKQFMTDEDVLACQDFGTLDLKPNVSSKHPKQVTCLTIMLEMKRKVSKAINIHINEYTWTTYVMMRVVTTTTFICDMYGICC